MQLERTQIGATVRTIRIRRGIRQIDLAAKAGMTAAQLCNAERGRTTLAVPTLRRLADALEVPIGTLFGQEPPYADMSTQGHTSGPDPAAVAHVTRATVIRSRQERERLGRTVDDAISLYLELETECGAFNRTALPLVLPFAETVDGAEALAGAVRRLCGVGTAIVHDWGELLESMGVRILHPQLSPDGPRSLSFYDGQNDNAFLVVDASLNGERNNFLTLFELGNVYLFTANGMEAVVDSHRNRHFAKMFAADLLMPREAIRATVSRLGLGPNGWTYELALRLKTRFGVSMESFLYRLGEVAVIDRSGLDALLERFRGEQSAHGIAYEPQPRPVAPELRGRFGDLAEMAGRAGRAGRAADTPPAERPESARNTAPAETLKSREAADMPPGKG